jgi:Ribosomal protein S3, C-terminal domain
MNTNDSITLYLHLVNPKTCEYEFHNTSCAKAVHTEQRGPQHPKPVQCEQTTGGSSLQITIRKNSNLYSKKVQAGSPELFLDSKQSLSLLSLGGLRQIVRTKSSSWQHCFSNPIFNLDSTLFCPRGGSSSIGLPVGLTEASLSQVKTKFKTLTRFKNLLLVADTKGPFLQNKNLGTLKPLSGASDKTMLSDKNKPVHPLLCINEKFCDKHKTSSARTNYEKGCEQIATQAGAFAGLPFESQSEINKDKKVAQKLILIAGNKRKHLSDLNHRMLSQSFLKHFLFQFTKAGFGPWSLTHPLTRNSTKSPLFSMNSLPAALQLQEPKTQREGHQITLSTWAPVFDFQGILPKVTDHLASKTGPREKARFFNLTARENTSGKLDSTIMTGLHKVPALKVLQKPVNPLLCINAKFGGKHKTCSHLTGCDKGYEQAKALTSNLQMYTPQTRALKQSLLNLFAGAKKEVSAALPVTTQFYSAVWLLEGIRSELSLRNANIKRVLNNTFLRIQEPFANSLSNMSSSSVLTPKIGKPTTMTAQSSKRSLPIPSFLKGLRLTFSGRLGGKKGMAKTLTKTIGRVPLSTLGAKVDFAKGVVHTKMGSLGVKVWVCYR